jgi:hypothetical protein
MDFLIFTVSIGLVGAQFADGVWLGNGLLVYRGWAPAIRGVRQLRIGWSIPFRAKSAKNVGTRRNCVFSNNEHQPADKIA